MIHDFHWFQLDNKRSYGASVTKWFVDCRLSTDQQTLFRSNFEANIKSKGETILVCFNIFYSSTFFYSIQLIEHFFVWFLCSIRLQSRNLTVMAIKLVNVS